MRITVNREKQEEISIIGAGLWLCGRIQYFEYFLWSSTSRGQRLRAHFVFFVFLLLLPVPLDRFVFSTSERNKATEWEDLTKKGKSVEIPVISVISVGISALWADHSVLCEIWGGSRDRVPRRSAQRQPQPAQPACTNITTVASAQNVMRWPVWLPCVGWMPRHMEETGRPSPMDTRLGTGEARPYPLQPQGEVEAWEEEGALWGEVRARLCLVEALEAPTQRANPRVAPK